MKSSFFTARTAMNAFETSSEDKKTDETPYPCHRRSKRDTQEILLTSNRQEHIYIDSLYYTQYKQNLGLQWWCSSHNL